MDPSSLHVCKAVFPDYDWSMEGDCDQWNGVEVLVGTGDHRLQVYMSHTVGVYMQGGPWKLFDGDNLLANLGHAREYLSEVAQKPVASRSAPEGAPGPTGKSEAQSEPQSG